MPPPLPQLPAPLSTPPEPSPPSPPVLPTGGIFTVSHSITIDGSIDDFDSAGFSGGLAEVTNLNPGQIELTPSSASVRVDIAIRNLNSATAAHVHDRLLALTQAVERSEVDELSARLNITILAVEQPVLVMMEAPDVPPPPPPSPRPALPLTIRNDALSDTSDANTANLPIILLSVIIALLLALIGGLGIYLCKRPGALKKLSKQLQAQLPQAVVGVPVAVPRAGDNFDFEDQFDNWNAEDERERVELEERTCDATRRQLAFTDEAGAARQAAEGYPRLAFTAGAEAAREASLCAAVPAVGEAVEVPADEYVSRDEAAARRRAQRARVVAAAAATEESQRNVESRLKRARTARALRLDREGSDNAPSDRARAHMPARQRSLPDLRNASPPLATVTEADERRSQVQVPELRSISLTTATSAGPDERRLRAQPSLAPRVDPTEKNKIVARNREDRLHRARAAKLQRLAEAEARDGARPTIRRFAMPEGEASSTIKTRSITLASPLVAQQKWLTSNIYLSPAGSQGADSDAMTDSSRDDASSIVDEAKPPPPLLDFRYSAIGRRWSSDPDPEPGRSSGWPQGWPPRASPPIGRPPPAPKTPTRPGRTAAPLQGPPRRHQVESPALTASTARSQTPSPVASTQAPVWIAADVPAEVALTPHRGCQRTPMRVAAQVMAPAAEQSESAAPSNPQASAPAEVAAVVALTPSRRQEGPPVRVAAELMQHRGREDMAEEDETASPVSTSSPYVSAQNTPAPPTNSLQTTPAPAALAFRPLYGLNSPAGHDRVLAYPDDAPSAAMGPAVATPDLTLVPSRPGNNHSALGTRWAPLPSPLAQATPTRTRAAAPTAASPTEDNGSGVFAPVYGVNSGPDRLSPRQSVSLPCTPQCTSAPPNTPHYRGIRAALTSNLSMKRSRLRSVAASQSSAGRISIPARAPGASPAPPVASARRAPSPQVTAAPSAANVESALVGPQQPPPLGVSQPRSPQSNPVCVWLEQQELELEREAREGGADGDLMRI